MAQKKTKKAVTKKTAAPQKVMAAKTGLGRGLSSLMSNREPAYDKIPTPASEDQSARPGKEIPIEFLVANTYQPRIHFDDEKAQELVESVKSKGFNVENLIKTSHKR